MTKTTILHVHHAFFVHFFAVTAQLRRENASVVSRFTEEVHKRQRNFLSISELE